MIQHLSAITFAVRDMREAVTFYTKLGFEVIYGGPEARFSSLRIGDAYVNLSLVLTMCRLGGAASFFGSLTSIRSIRPP